MAATSGIKIEGMEDLDRVLGQMAPRASRNLMRSTIQGIAQEIAKESKRKAPKDKGVLRKAIKAKRRRPRNPDKPFSDVIVTHGRGAKYDAFYWRFVEFGTQDRPEHPFIRPAVDLMRPKIPEIMERQFAKKLEAMLKRAARKGKR